MHTHGSWRLSKLRKSVSMFERFFVEGVLTTACSHFKSYGLLDTSGGPIDEELEGALFECANELKQKSWQGISNVRTDTLKGGLLQLGKGLLSTLSLAILANISTCLHRGPQRRKASLL